MSSNNWEKLFFEDQNIYEKISVLGGHREDGRNPEKGREVRECHEHKRTTEKDEAKQNGKTERSRRNVKVSAALPLGAAREPAGCARVRRRRKKVDRDEKHSFFI